MSNQKPDIVTLAYGKVSLPSVPGWARGWFDEKELMLHGLKSSPNIREPLIESRPCPKCRAENGPIALYCQTCGEPITRNDRKLAELEERLKDLDKYVRTEGR